MKYQYKKAPPVQEYSVKNGHASTAGDLQIIGKDIPCQNACPARTNVPLYIENIARGDYGKAYEVNLEDNVFPGVLGRVCTRPCEADCRHQWTNVNGPVRICHLKRSAADHYAATAKIPAPYFEETNKRVAIIGGGPAGLATAREIKRLGHAVTLFERENRFGGMMINGIPRFRLPAEVVEKEVQLILQTGIDAKLNENITTDRLTEIMSDYDAVCLTSGTMKVSTLDIPGVPSELMLSGLDFMYQYNNSQITKLNGDVLVVGGGFTAVDCARSSARAARRLLGKGGNITILYRRSEEYMAANADELEEIERENITIRTLATPVSGEVVEGELRSVTFRRNMLAADRSSGKPKMIPVPDSEFTLPCRHLIVAIGQTRDLGILPDGLDLTEGFGTTKAHVFATGDFATGSDNVIKAVANGKAVALEIDKYLMGEERLRTVVNLEQIPDEKEGFTGRIRDHDMLIGGHMPVATLHGRAQNNAEVEEGFDCELAKTHAHRCYFCHYKYEIDQDKCIHCDWCIQAAPRECIKRVSRIYHDDEGVVDTVIEANLSREATYIWIDSNECIRCGKCLRVCPTNAIFMAKAAISKVRKKPE